MDELKQLKQEIVNVTQQFFVGQLDYESWLTRTQQLISQHNEHARAIGAELLPEAEN